MVDEERVTRLLARVRADVEALREWAAMPDEEVLGDETVLAAAKYRFVTAVEGWFKVAHHVIVSEGWDVPETNADAVRELARRGVLPAAVGEALAGAACFRNVLVHQYVDVDDSKVVANLGRLGDIDAFVAAVLAWLDR